MLRFLGLSIERHPIHCAGDRGGARPVGGAEGREARQTGHPVYGTAFGPQLRGVLVLCFTWSSPAPGHAVHRVRVRNVTFSWSPLQVTL